MKWERMNFLTGWNKNKYELCFDDGEHLFLVFHYSTMKLPTGMALRSNFLLFYS